MGEATQIADAGSLKADLRSLIGRTIGSPDAKVMARMIMRTMGEIADDPDLMAIYRERVLRPRLNQASALVRRARARGELRKDLPADLAAMPIAMRAYGRTCAYCDKVIGDIDFLKHNSGVIGSDGRSQEWTTVPPEQLSDALRTRRLVCWNCHMAETFRRLHPELVTDR